MEDGLQPERRLSVNADSVRDARQPKRSLGEQDKVYKWLNPVYGSFDDFGSAMLVLYVMSSRDNWFEPMCGTAPVKCAPPPQ